MLEKHETLGRLHAFTPLQFARAVVCYDPLDVDVFIVLLYTNIMRSLGIASLRHASPTATSDDDSLACVVLVLARHFSQFTVL